MMVTTKCWGRGTTIKLALKEQLSHLFSNKAICFVTHLENKFLKYDSLLHEQLELKKVVFKQGFTLAKVNLFSIHIT